MRGRITSSTLERITPGALLGVYMASARLHIEIGGSVLLYQGIVQTRSEFSPTMVTVEWMPCEPKWTATHVVAQYDSYALAWRGLHQGDATDCDTWMRSVAHQARDYGVTPGGILINFDTMHALDCQLVVMPSEQVGSMVAQRVADDRCFRPDALTCVELGDNVQPGEEVAMIAVTLYEDRPAQFIFATGEGRVFVALSEAFGVVLAEGSVLIRTDSSAPVHVLIMETCLGIVGLTASHRVTVQSLVSRGTV